MALQIFTNDYILESIDINDNNVSKFTITCQTEVFSEARLMIGIIDCIY